MTAVIRQEPGAFIPSDLIEAHDPRRISSISDELRRPVDELLWKKLGWAALDRAIEAERFVVDLAKVDELSPLILSTSGRGHIREAAVRNTNAVRGPFALALLIQRLNDWVPQVRAVAEAKVTTLLSTLRPSVIAGCIEALWGFEGVGRASFAGREIVKALLREASAVVGGRDWLLQIADDRAVGLIRGILRTGAADEHMALFARVHPHPRVRAVAAKAVLEEVYAWRNGRLRRRVLTHSVDRLALALDLLHDRSVEVQYWALQYLTQHDTDAATLGPILNRYLLHPRRKLSELAQWKLNKRRVDWLSWVRREFAASPHDLRLARLLARVGVASDADAVWQSAMVSLEDQRFGFVAAAAQLQHQGALNDLERLALSDSDLAVARRAAATLMEAKAPISADALKGAASEGEAFAKRGLLAHARRHDVMAQLEIFCKLEAAGSPPEPIEFTRLSRKVNRGRFEYSAADRERLRQLSTGCARVNSWMRRLLIL